MARENRPPSASARRALEHAQEGLEELRRTLGTPPPAFHRREGAATTELPLAAPTGELQALLTARKTTRTFDPARPTTLAELAVVLRSTFGAHGAAMLADDLVVVRKSSPSGGGMHPIEAYPLVVRVDGIEPGIYHYDAERHALTCLEQLTAEAAEALVEVATAGQSYLRSAHVLVVLTARFRRSFWRYRGHPKAYAVLLLDAGHLSQTLLLVCTDLGLGAYVTAAINNANIDERLRVDPREEGAILACGLGRAAAREELQVEFAPFVPHREAEPDL